MWFKRAVLTLAAVAGLGLTLLTGLAAFKLPKLFTLLMTVAAALWPLGTAFWMTGRTLAEVYQTRAGENTESDDGDSLLPGRKKPVFETTSSSTPRNP